MSCSIHPPSPLFSPSLLIFLCLYVSGVLLLLCLCLCLCVAWTCLNWPRLPRRSFKRWVLGWRWRSWSLSEPFFHWQGAGTGSGDLTWNHFALFLYKNQFSGGKIEPRLWSETESVLVIRVILLQSFSCHENKLTNSKRNPNSAKDLDVIL